MEKLHFQTHVQLKNIIGKDLITNDNIAILELVKNAYDANSTKAQIIFENIKDNDDLDLKTRNSIHYTENTSRIIVQDFGIGMNESDIKEKWLNIAYSEKKKEKKRFNRFLAGNKGVGRFSCDRLGEYLNLYSRKENNDIVHLFINWNLFEVENKDKTIQQIDLIFKEISPDDFEEETGYEIFESGTILEISKLRTDWTHQENFKNKKVWSNDKLLDLRKQLERLINPNQAYSANVFQITIKSKEFLEEDKNSITSERVNGEVGNKIFEKLNFRTTSITSELDDKGKEITTTLHDKGKTIFKLVEKNQFPNLKNTKIVIYYLNPYSKAYFTKQTGIRSVDFGSIYFFINGFRVSPYGDAGDDWLGIEQRKAQGTMRFISTRDIVGRIEILDEMGDFKIVSSREGIEKNENYNLLTNRDGYFFKTFKRLERYVVKGIEWDSIPEILKTKIREIETKVINEEWSVEDEEFAETDSAKFRRIYKLIHSIIGAKRDEVISLYVNEDLILQKVAEEREIAEKDFEKLLDDFSKKKVNVEVMNRVLGKKAELDKRLLKQIQDFSKYPTEETTTKAILELETIRGLIRKQEDQIKLLLKENEELKKKEKRKKVENRKKDKIILFQQKLLSKDAEQLIEFHHIIGISADTIDKHLTNLKNDLNKGKSPSEKDLFEFIEDISYESKKIISITNLATAANFDADTDEMTSDLIEFIKQYVEKVSLGTLTTYDGTKKIKIKILDTIKQEFICHFKPIEIAIMIDNLFSNSRKAKATAIEIYFKMPSEENLEIKFKDNGRGVNKVIQDNIFDFGFTTTSGSGLGLHHIKKIMKEEYDGHITFNRNLKIGAEFTLNFHI